MTENMNTAQADYSIGQDRGWEKQLFLEAPGVSPWLIIPEKVNSVQVTIIPSGGATGSVETTTDLVSVIKAGGAEPDEWPWGVVSEKQSHSCRPPSGIRLKQVSAGNLKLTLRAQ